MPPIDKANKVSTIMTRVIFRKQHTKKVIQLALPMAITQLISISSGFLCMAMVAKLGHDVLAASALITSIITSILIIAASLLFSLSILIGHAYGEKNYLTIGSLLQQGWFLGIIIGIPTLIIYWKIYSILIFFGQEKLIARIVEQYFHASIWRVLPFFFSVSNQQLCYGVNKQKVDMFANIIGVFVLVISAYILIFGKFGLPALGIAGFGYASAMQGWFYFLVTTACLYFMHDFKKFTLFSLRIHQTWHTLKYLFKIGWPISLQITGEMLSFLASTTFVGWLGSNSLAAYQVVIQYQLLIVVPVFAISQASGILVGQAYGSKQFADIKKLGHASLRITIIISLLIGLVFILFPRILASVYLNPNSPTNAQIVHLIAMLFLVIAFSQFFDAIRNVLTGSLRGLLDTKFPMIVGLLSIWAIGVPLGYIFAFSLHWGAIGVVSGWMIGIILGAVILYYRWQALSTKFGESYKIAGI